MTQQYPSPYQPYSMPQAYGGYDPMHAYLGRARRASVLMFILSGLGVVCGLCVGLVAMFAPMEQLLAESGMQLPSLEGTSMTPAQLIQIGYIVMAVLSLLFSILILVLAIFVRRGSLGATITSIVLLSIVGLLLLLNALATVAQIRGVAGPEALVVVVFGLLLALVGLQIWWLIGAARACGQIRELRMQYQMQAWQYQQQQQAHSQGGYNYPQQAMQPPPPPPGGSTSQLAMPPFNPPPPPADGGSDGTSSKG